MFCPKCGNQQPNQTRVCVKCGLPLPNAKLIERPEPQAQPAQQLKPAVKPVLEQPAPPSWSQSPQTPPAKTQPVSNLNWDSSQFEGESKIQPLKQSATTPASTTESYVPGQYLGPYLPGYQPGSYLNGDSPNWTASNNVASNRAIASLICALLSFTFCPVLSAAIAVILGHFELNAIKDGSAPPAGHTIAKIGYYVGLANIGLFISFFIFIVFISSL